MISLIGRKKLAKSCLLINNLLITRGGVNETDHNMDELRADQKGDHLITGTFWKTFLLMNPSSLCIENIVYQLLRLYVIDFVKISRVNLFLWSALSSDSFTHNPLY